MIDALTTTVLAWLLTYLIHSTVLLGIAWVLTRTRSWPAAVLDLMWKTALVGGLVTATGQIALEVRPAGSVSLAAPAEPTAATAASSTMESSRPTKPVVQETESASPIVTESSLLAAPAAQGVTSLPVHAAALLTWALIGLALGLSYAARRLILVGRIGDRRAVLDGRLLDELDRLTGEAGLRKSPRLTSTERISSPIALGLAEICVPESALTDLDLEQQRSMLAHELAHLARRDPLWLAFASVVERVLWIQPLNRVARRQIATAAEYLCDEWAVRRTGSGVALARCIAQVAEWIQASPLGVPVAGMAEERSLLVSRVEKLLSTRVAEPRSRRALVLLAAAVVVATIAVAPGVSGTAARASTAFAAPFGLDADVPATAQPHEVVGARSSEPASESDVRGMTHSPELDAEVASSGSRIAAAQRSPSRDSTVVAALIGRLKDEDAAVRRAAADALGKFEDARAVPALVSALGDRDAGVRAAAAGALGSFHDPRAIRALTALLTDASRDVRKHALDALSEYETGVKAEDIVPLLKDADADLRHSAAHALGQLGDRSAGAALAPLVRDPSPEVRAAAIEAIGQLHDATHGNVLVFGLGDSDTDVRRQALEALDELRTPIPEAMLLTLLRDRDADVRQKAAEIAGERSVLAAIPSLRRMFEDPDEDVREHAVSALAEMASDAAADALRAALDSKDPKVRRAAVEALGERRP